MQLFPEYHVYEYKVKKKNEVNVKVFREGTTNNNCLTCEFYAISHYVVLNHTVSHLETFTTAPNVTDTLYWTQDTK